MAAQRLRPSLVPLFFAACLSSVSATSVAETVVEHAIAGRLDRFDRAASTFEVRTSFDVIHTLTFTSDTRLAGLTDAAILSDLAGYPGTYVVARYRLDGERKLATAVHWVGSKEPLTVEGRIVRLDKAWRSIIVSTMVGSELFLLIDNPVLDTDDGIVSLDDFAAHPGDHVRLTYTIRDRHRIVHLLRLARARSRPRWTPSSR